MRIVGGNFRGRKLFPPDGHATRPTSDRTREALFNILRHGIRVEFKGADILDLFAGSGALGLEALSRGATACTFIEQNKSAVKCIENNLAALALTERGTVLELNASQLPNRPADLPPAQLAFLDPPYSQGLAMTALTSLKQGNWLADRAVIVAETDSNEGFTAPAPYTLANQRTYGTTTISFLQV